MTAAKGGIRHFFLEFVFCRPRQVSLRIGFSWAKCVLVCSANLNMRPPVRLRCVLRYTWKVKSLTWTSVSGFQRHEKIPGPLISAGSFCMPKAGKERKTPIKGFEWPRAGGTSFQRRRKSGHSGGGPELASGGRVRFRGAHQFLGAPLILGEDRSAEGIQSGKGGGTKGENQDASVVWRSFTHFSTFSRIAFASVKSALIDRDLSSSSRDFSNFFWRR